MSNQAVMRCKLVLHHIENPYFKGSDEEASAHVKFGAVWEGSADKQAASENALFGKMTPQAEFVAVIKNPNVIAALKQGEEFYVDFTPVKQQN